MLENKGKINFAGKYYIQKIVSGYLKRTSRCLKYLISLKIHILEELNNHSHVMSLRVTMLTAASLVMVRALPTRLTW